MSRPSQTLTDEDSLLSFGEKRSTSATPFRQEGATVDILKLFLAVLSPPIQRYMIIIGSFCLFGYCALYPDPMRFATSCAFTVLMGITHFYWNRGGK